MRPNITEPREIEDFALFGAELIEIANIEQTIVHHAIAGIIQVVDVSPIIIMKRSVAFLLTHSSFSIGRDYQGLRESHNNDKRRGTTKARLPMRRQHRYKWCGSLLVCAEGRAGDNDSNYGDCFASNQSRAYMSVRARSVQRLFCFPSVIAC